MESIKKFKKTKNIIIFLGVLFVLILINFFIYFLGPEKIVDFIGVENTYFIVFAIATIGGLSTLTGTVLFSTIIAFVAGGVNPFLLGTIGGMGIFISDTIFYTLALYGRKSAPQNWEYRIEKIEKWMKKYPSWLILTIVYIYISFTPLPNDILMIILVLGGYSYKKIATVLLMGSLTIAMITAYIGNVWFLFS
jgi:hypothetical protein